ncbi:MAG: VOC family protein [Burkholderiales bacterium]
MMNDERASSTLGSAASSQVQAAGSLNIDHVSHFVPDMDEASAALERLGFTLTPFSAQSHRLERDGPLVPAGTANRCVMLKRGYLEFLTPTAETPVADQLRSAMRRYVGIHLVAFGTAAAEADHERLVKQGFEPLTPVALQRPIGTEIGEDTARFTVVRVPPGTMAEGRIQYCQQLTPELLWQRRWLSHRNGATGLGAVLVCVRDPVEAAQRYSRFTGIPAARYGNTWRLDTPRGTLILADAETFSRTLGASAPALPWIGGYALECDDLEVTRTYLCGANIEAREVQGRLLVTMPAALGGSVIFQPRGSAVPQL